MIATERKKSQIKQQTERKHVNRRRCIMNEHHTIYVHFQNLPQNGHCKGSQSVSTDGVGTPKRASFPSLWLPRVCCADL